MRKFTFCGHFYTSFQAEDETVPHPIVTDEMLGWAGESRNGFLCTCEGVEFLEYIRTSFFPFNCLLLFYILNVYNGI